MNYAFDQIARAQEACRGERPSVARAILCAHFPHKTESFFKRNLQLVLTLTPEQVVKVVGYPDPTGERAVRHVLATA